MEDKVGGDGDGDGGGGCAKDVDPDTSQTMYNSSLPESVEDVGSLLETASMLDETGMDNFLNDICEQVGASIPVIMNEVCNHLELDIPRSLVPYLPDEKESAESDVATSEPSFLPVPAKAPSEEPPQTKAPQLPPSGTRVSQSQIVASLPFFSKWRKIWI